MRLHDVVPLDDVTDADARFYRFWFTLAVVVSSIALLLSLAGIYAVTAFTVSRRTREIGIRLALGAEAGRIVVAILRRPLTQVGIGVLFGGAVVATLEGYGERLAAVSAYALLMLAVCLLACVVPARRALRVEPTEALRTDA
jgi:ABC-type antimicrobial peptide transport system permease subunit